MTANERKHFGSENIEHYLGMLGDNLRTPVEVVLIGGGAMSFKGDKEATKDVDMVVRSKSHFNEIIYSAKKNGFENRTRGFPDYRKLEATVLVNDDEFHIDLFLQTVCKRFRVHEGIIERTAPFKQFGLLDVRLLSDEDLFLSKSVTERDHDLLDMYVLYLKGIDHKRIMKEMDLQNKFSGTLWEAFMVRKLDEMEEKFNIMVPWKEEVENVAVEKMEERFLTSG